VEKLTRRKLMIQASAGTGAVSLLAVTAACAPRSADASIPTSLSGHSVSTTDEPLAVFVTDPKQGTLTIMKGDREITVNNLSLANSLLSLI
jgi:hypothetical protein